MCHWIRVQKTGHEPLQDGAVSVNSMSQWVMKRRRMKKSDHGPLVLWLSVTSYILIDNGKGLAYI